MATRSDLEAEQETPEGSMSAVRRTSGDAGVEAPETLPARSQRLVLAWRSLDDLFDAERPISTRLRNDLPLRNGPCTV